MASPGQQIEVRRRVHSLSRSTVRTVGQITFQARTGRACTLVLDEFVNLNINLDPGILRTRRVGSATRVIESNGHMDSAYAVERA